MQDLDVLTIGAGIYGSSSAIALCRAGHSVTLMEKDAAWSGLWGRHRPATQDRVICIGQLGKRHMGDQHQAAADVMARFAQPI